MVQNGQIGGWLSKWRKRKENKCDDGLTTILTLSCAKMARKNALYEKKKISNVARMAIFAKFTNA